MDCVTQAVVFLLQQMHKSGDSIASTQAGVHLDRVLESVPSQVKTPEVATEATEKVIVRKTVSGPPEK
jgi:hypothetical protein